MAVPQLPYHLHVVLGALTDALRLNGLALALEELHLLPHLGFDLRQCPRQLVLGGDIVVGGVDGNVIQDAHRRTGDYVDLADAIHLISPELHPNGVFLGVDRIDLHRVSSYTKHISVKGDVVALVADLDELFQQSVSVILHASAQADDHIFVVDGVAQTVDAADGGDNDHIPPFKEGGGGAVAQPVDLLVDAGVLLNEGVRVGDICLRLIIVVVGDEILDSIVREKLLELRTELGGQRFVVRQHQRRTLHPFDDLGHGEGLAAAGDPL